MLPRRHHERVQNHPDFDLVQHLILLRVRFLTPEDRLSGDVTSVLRKEQVLVMVLVLSRS